MDKTVKKLSTSEAERYARNLRVEGFGEEQQGLLLRSRILVVGAGGLGSAVLSYCAAAGIGHIGIVDDDTVSLSNLQRQVLYTEEDLGAPKACRAALRLKALNPAVNVRPFVARFTGNTAEALVRGQDAVVDCTDNYPARYVLDRWCGRLGVPLVYGTAEQGGGQVSVFHYRGAGGYADLFPEPPAPAEGPPGVLSPLPGIVGSLQALEVIKVLTGWGEPLAGRLLVLDGRSLRMGVYEL